MKRPLLKRSAEIETRSQDLYSPSEGVDRPPLVIPAWRPSRLSAPMQGFIFLLLGVSFATGVLLWRGAILQEEQVMAPPTWLTLSRSIHGALNPFLCGLFGYLFALHMRVGWQKRKNRLSGVSMASGFGLLILSGMALYHGNEVLRHWASLIHKWVGLILPLLLALHAVSAWRGANKP